MSSLNLDYFFGKIYDFFKWAYHLVTHGFSVGHWFGILLGILTAAFLFVIFYSTIRIREMEQDDEKRKLEKMQAAIPAVAPRHDKWEVIRAHMFTQNQAEWRLAIIEADTILEELTIKLGLPGQSLGDRLKNVTPADFNTVQAAWEAHKVRNRIAHDGSNYELTHAEANRVIRMYEDVFNEFHYI